MTWLPVRVDSAVRQAQLIATSPELSSLRSLGRRSTSRLCAGPGVVFAVDQVAVAERRDAGDEQRQGERLQGQVTAACLKALAEQEQSEQARREWIKNREAGLGRRKRAGREPVRRQQQARRAGAEQHVNRPVGEDFPGTAAE